MLAEIVESVREVSISSGQYGIPVWSSRPHSHFLYEYLENRPERNIAGRQMGVSDFSATDLCSLLQMQVGNRY